MDGGGGCQERERRPAASRTRPSPKEAFFIFFFFAFAWASQRRRCGLFPLKPLTLVLMAFQPQDCRCRKVIAECSWVSLLSYTHAHTSLPFFHTLVVSLCVSLSLYLSRYVFPRFYSIPLFSRLVTPGQCQRLKTIVLAERVSSLMERSVLQPLDCLQTRHAFRVYVIQSRCRTSSSRAKL